MHRLPNQYNTNPNPILNLVCEVKEDVERILGRSASLLVPG
jgi:hypothetical protein